jgi:peptidoglycan/xylan/chitin deacetylase (PgdA/CDA1 family)
MLMPPCQLLFFCVAVLTFIPAMPVIAADSAVVLMYHRFGEDRYPSTSIRADQFEAQLKHLRDNNFTVVPLTDVIATLNEGQPLPPRAVAITIDDAYRSVYEVGYPRLREYGYPFTVFVATDPVDQGLPAYMSWDQMRAMQEGGASFANHGASHDSLIARQAGESDNAWLARVRADVDKGWQRVSAELEPIPGVFAYPYGEYDTVVANMLRKAGYISFGQQSGAVGSHSDTRALPRFPMAESFAGMDQFRTKVASLPMPVLAVTPWDPVVTTRQPRIEVTLGDANNEARLAELACFVSGQGRVEVQWLETGRRFAVGPDKPVGTGRQRVNCTAPRSDGRYLWFSHAWIVRSE